MHDYIHLPVQMSVGLPMISAKLVIKSVMIMFAVALTGFVLLFFDQSIGRPIAIAAVFCGAFVGFIGGFALMLGRLKDDLRD